MNFDAAVVQIIIYLLVGSAAGLISGLMGVGGGIVIVPSLVFLFNIKKLFPPDLIMPAAVATSLAIMIFTSQSSIRVHYKQNNLPWSTFKKHLLPGVIIGPISGVLISGRIPTPLLKALFGFMLVIVAIKMFLDLKVTKIHAHGFPSDWINFLIISFIGCLSGLLGIGGSLLIIIYLNYCGLDVKQTVPIAALCTFTVALIGTISYILVCTKRPDLPAYTTGFVYWPAAIAFALPSGFFAPIGAKLTYVLPTKQLRYGFIVLLLVTAVRLLI